MWDLDIVPCLESQIMESPTKLHMFCCSLDVRQT